MEVFRLCRHDRTAMDGIGGLYADGRWSPLGRRLVYTAASRALAALEIRVNQRLAPLGWVIMSIQVPEPLIEALGLHGLPTGWRERRELTQSIGEEWAGSLRSVVLSVPSSVIPEERNYLINPLHPRAGEVEVTGITPFHFDPRLFRGPA